MKTLSRLREILNSKSKQEYRNFFIPKKWNLINYQRYYSQNEYQLEVNPYDFYLEIINYIQMNKINNVPTAMSISNYQKNHDNGEWIKSAIIYSMQIRTSTAYNHNNFDISSGTFLKTIGLIPYLMYMGIDLLYLLPIAKIGNKYKKGDLGSPYAIDNFLQLEQSLADQLIPELSAEQQFKALVEALHCVNIRVCCDFIPRTIARSSSLIKEYPEWFYYIKSSSLSNYKAPYVSALDKLSPANPTNMKIAYQDKNVKKFLQNFSKGPHEINLDKWNSIKDKENFLDLMETEFGITIAPAFADVINDPQPPWDDVSYLRLYLDHPIKAKVKANQPPYILFDVAKSSLNPGKIINQALWDIISQTIPYYQKKFGIDCARIDMGHALPEELSKKIINEARVIDKSFAFIAEELNNDGAYAAKQQQYNAIVSDAFYKIPRVADFLFHQYVYDAIKYPLPLLFQIESHDTPRAISREGGATFSKMALAFSLFVPNTIPFINSGQEIYENIPMNTGLDHDGKNYQKLPLFDLFHFNYDTSASDLIDLLHNLTRMRKEILSPTSLPLGFLHMRQHGAGFAYLHQDKAYLVIAHTNVKDSENICVKFDNVKKALNKYINSATLFYSTHENSRTIYSFNFDGSLNLWMQPGEIKIILY